MERNRHRSVPFTSNILFHTHLTLGDGFGISEVFCETEQNPRLDSLRQCDIAMLFSFMKVHHVNGALKFLVFSVNIICMHTHYLYVIVCILQIIYVYTSCIHCYEIVILQLLQSLL